MQCDGLRAQLTRVTIEKNRNVALRRRAISKQNEVLALLEIATGETTNEAAIFKAFERARAEIKMHYRAGNLRAVLALSEKHPDLGEFAQSLLQSRFFSPQKPKGGPHPPPAKCAKRSVPDGAAKSGQKLFKCGETGHWASDRMCKPKGTGSSSSGIQR
jgi:hypothetical protein